MKLKGPHFETVSDIQRELQVVLNSINKMTSTVLLKCEKRKQKNNGITVYVPKETILKGWQPKLGKLSQNFFFDIVRELSDTPHVTGNEGWH
jgi:hypothetical protein